MPTLREPAVAGLFYPADAAELKRTVLDLLATARGENPPPKAIIAPHAGYPYSGPVAASAYAHLALGRDRIERVVLLGPAHRVGFFGLASCSAERFRTPLGDVAVDSDALADLPGVRCLEEAHRLEHSLEVQLPFLQLVLGTFTLLPLVVGEAPPEMVASVLERLWGGPQTAVVVSSDLSHYLDYHAALARDRATAAAIEGLRFEAIGPGQACGCHPVNGLLRFARGRGLRARTVDLRNSGDTAGSRERVVGYGAFLFHEARDAR